MTPQRHESKIAGPIEENKLRNSFTQEVPPNEGTRNREHKSQARDAAESCGIEG